MIKARWSIINENCKLMSCVWWDWKEIVHYELLLSGKMIDSLLSTINAIEAIDSGKAELINRKDVVFHHVNVRLHIFLIGKNWENLILMHPPHNSDLAPSDYHLYQFLQNSNRVNLILKEAEKILFFCSEIPKVLHWSNNSFTRKMAESYRSKFAHTWFNKRFINNFINVF